MRKENVSVVAWRTVYRWSDRRSRFQRVSDQPLAHLRAEASDPPTQRRPAPPVEARQSSHVAKGLAFTRCSFCSLATSVHFSAKARMPKRPQESRLGFLSVAFPGESESPPRTILT